MIRSPGTESWGTSTVISSGGDPKTGNQRGSGTGVTEARKGGRIEKWGLNNNKKGTKGEKKKIRPGKCH